MTNRNGSDKGALDYPNCGWCGKILNELNAARPREFITRERERNIHAKCEDGREWLLECIRYSDHAAKYVARVEAREAPLRAQRRQLKSQLTVPELPLLNSQPAPAPSAPVEAEISAAVQRDMERRMVNLENMLSKLVKELGA